MLESLKRAVEMAQWSGTLDSLSEELGSLPSSHIISQDLCNPSFKGSKTFFWLPWAPRMCVTHRHTCRLNTHIHKIKIKFQKIL